MSEWPGSMNTNSMLEWPGSMNINYSLESFDDLLNFVRRKLENPLCLLVTSV